MKYQVVEISEYLINSNDYNNMEEAMTCFNQWIEDAKEYPILRIKNIYITKNYCIVKAWNADE